MKRVYLQHSPQKAAQITIKALQMVRRLETWLFSDTSGRLQTANFMPSTKDLSAEIQ